MTATQTEYVNGLSETQKESLTWYTGGDFDIFNETLRKGGDVLPIHLTHLQNISSSFESAPPLQEPIVVYKGIDTDNVYSDDAFVSTSSEYNVAATSFSDKKECCVIQITVSPGSLVLPLMSVSREPEENEVLLDRGGTLLVTGSTIRTTMKVIFATYTPKNSVKVTSEVQPVEAAAESVNAVARTIAFFADDEDPEFLDEEDLRLYYTKITGDTDIPDEDMRKIKDGLGIV
jgi:hypothetical protein